MRRRRRNLLIEVGMISLSVLIFVFSEAIRIQVLYPLLGDADQIDSWYNGILTTGIFLFIEGSIQLVGSREEDEDY